MYVFARECNNDDGLSFDEVDGKKWEPPELIQIYEPEEIDEFKLDIKNSIFNQVDELEFVKETVRLIEFKDVSKIEVLEEKMEKFAELIKNEKWVKEETAKEIARKNKYQAKMGWKRDDVVNRKTGIVAKKRVNIADNCE